MSPSTSGSRPISAQGLEDDFADLLSASGRKGLYELERRHRPRVTRAAPILVVNGWLNASKARRYLDVLDRHVVRHLTPISAPIPRSTITGMRRNYSEQLPKTVSALTAELNRPNSIATRTARSLGLIDVLSSPTLRRLGEAATGLRLRDIVNLQILLYRPGHYSGPHNDHHPETPATRGGYVDIHLTLANDAVAHQWLVCEESGHFSRIESVATLGALSVFLLPFWHYTTPLVARPGLNRSARRWVMMVTYTVY